MLVKNAMSVPGVEIEGVVAALAVVAEAVEVTAEGQVVGVVVVVEEVEAVVEAESDPFCHPSIFPVLLDLCVCVCVCVCVCAQPFPVSRTPPFPLKVHAYMCLSPSLRFPQSCPPTH